MDPAANLHDQLLNGWAPTAIFGDREDLLLHDVSISAYNVVYDLSVQ